MKKTTKSAIKPYEEIAPLLGTSKAAWEKLVGYIRVFYMMNELWDEGKPDSSYCNALKFRYGSKTLVTLYVRDGFFKVNLVFGKGERAKFEEQQATFPAYLRKLYADTQSYHDGKWLWIDVRDSVIIDDIIHLLHIKRKPNRKSAVISFSPQSERCTNRCDICLLYLNNNETQDERFEFHKGDYRCCHAADPDKGNNDSSNICDGRRDNYEVVRCAAEKGLSDCSQCNYHACNINTNNFINPGRCDLGLTAEDVTRLIIPDCGME